MQPSTDLLLQTKIRVPRMQPQLVERQALIERLNTGVWRRLTQVSAPPGFGKTTLLVAWAHRAERPFAWLTLDESDNSLERFLRYLVAALQKVYPEFGVGLLPTLQAPTAPDAAQWVTGLVNDLEAQARPAVLVLDDAHVLSAPAIFEFLNQWIENLPENLHLVVAGRTDLPLSTARLRGRGELTEVRAADLRFSTQEASLFLNQMGLSLTPQQVEVLENRTEGWIAGLQLAALSMRDRSDTERFIRVFTGSHRFVLDYLADEVLQRQSAETQEFLLRTSVLDRFTAEVCAELLNVRAEGEPEGMFSAQLVAARLADLERANLFLVPLDDERRWYRYHTLFADLLRYRLNLAHPELVARLHQRAAAWFEQAGLAEEAVTQWIAAGDLNKAGALIEETCGQLMNVGQSNRVMGWLESIPPAVYAIHPRLYLVITWGLMMRNQFMEIEPYLDKAEEAIVALTSQPGGPSPDAWRVTLAEINATRALIASIRGDLDGTIELSNRTLANLPEDHAMRSSLLIGLGVAYYLTGHIQEALETMDLSIQAALQVHQVLVAISAMCNLGDHLVETGDLDRAMSYERQAIHLAEQQSPNQIPSISLAYSCLSEIAFQQNDLVASKAEIQKSLELDQTWQNQDIHVINLARLARLQFACGDREAAVRTLEEARGLAGTINLTHHITVFMAAIEAQFAIVLGQPLLDWERVEATILQLQTGALTLKQALDLYRWNTEVSLAEAGGNPTCLPEAILRLGEIREFFRSNGLYARVVDADLSLANAHALLGEGQAASTALATAVRLAQPGSLIHTFLERGPAIQALLANLLAEAGAHSLERSHVDFIQRVLAAFDQLPAPYRPSLPAGGGSTAPNPAPAAVEKPALLSEREIEVLGLVAEGLSNPDIANRLTLSTGTVKRHIHNIFEKLDVENRPAAVHRARQLGYL